MWGLYNHTRTTRAHAPEGREGGGTARGGPARPARAQAHSVANSTTQPRRTRKQAQIRRERAPMRAPPRPVPSEWKKDGKDLRNTLRAREPSIKEEGVDVEEVEGAVADRGVRSALCR